MEYSLKDKYPSALLLICVSAFLTTCFGNPNADCPTDLCICQQETATNRRVIDCRNRGLQEIPYFRPSEEVFQEILFKDIQTGGPANNISHILSNAFMGLRVKSIDLRTNFLRYVDANAFTSVADDVESLTLEGNGFVFVPLHSISVLKKLKTLRLHNFFLTRITKDNFDMSHFNELEELQLSNMLLKRVSGDAFVGRLPKLRTLKLSYLSLVQFPSAGFSTLTSLERIDAIYNGFNTIEYQSFSHFSRLKYLDLSHNNISKLQPGCFEGIERNLQYLYLHKNKLTESNVGPLASARWSELVELRLAFNHLKSIPDGLFFNMNSLRELYLDYNSISDLSQGSFQGLQQLRFLDLSYNSLRGLVTNGFQHVQNIERLDLRGQNSARFYISNGGLNGTENSLKRLILSNTPVVESVMWNAVGTLRSLEFLQLDETRLSNIPDFQFLNNGDLRSLSLSNNDIREINRRKMAGLVSLVDFSMQNNKLTTLDPCTFGDMSKFESFYISRNPLNCDCEMVWFKDWMTEKEEADLKFRYSISADCHQPKRDSLFRIEKEEMCGQVQPTIRTCENITLTTVTVIPEQTTKKTGNDDESLLKFTQISETQNTIEVAWANEYSYSFSGYTLQYQLLGENANVFDVALDRTETNYVIRDLRRNSQYLVCLTASPRGRLIVQQQKACLAVRTLK